jgi:hypothetical protein
VRAENEKWIINLRQQCCNNGAENGKEIETFPWDLLLQLNSNEQFSNYSMDFDLKIESNNNRIINDGKFSLSVVFLEESICVIDGSEFLINIYEEKKLFRRWASKIDVNKPHHH